MGSLGVLEPGQQDQFLSPGLSSGFYQVCRGLSLALFPVAGAGYPHQRKTPGRTSRGLHGWAWGQGEMLLQPSSASWLTGSGRVGVDNPLTPVPPPPLIGMAQPALGPGR